MPLPYNATKNCESREAAAAFLSHIDKREGRFARSIFDFRRWHSPPNADCYWPPTVVVPPSMCVRQISWGPDFHKAS